MNKFLAMLTVIAFTLGVVFWLSRPVGEAPAAPNRHEAAARAPATMAAAVTKPPVRNLPARASGCVATNASDCPSTSGELDPAGEPTDAAGRPPKSVSVAHEMAHALDSVRVGMDTQLEQYLTWSRLCRASGPQGCNQGDLEAADAAFVSAITPRADAGGLAAQEALGGWWYMRGENSLARHLQNRGLQASPDNEEAIRAEMCLARRETPGLVDATAKALHYFRLAESQGAPRSPYVGFMTECVV